jgi:hypothetical protein
MRTIKQLYAMTMGASVTLLASWYSAMTPFISEVLIFAAVAAIPALLGYLVLERLTRPRDRRERA